LVIGGTRSLGPPYAAPIAKDPGAPGLARIRTDATVSEPVREKALEFARQWKTE